MASNRAAFAWLAFPSEDETGVRFHFPFTLSAPQVLMSEHRAPLAHKRVCAVLLTHVERQSWTHVQALSLRGTWLSCGCTGKMSRYSVRGRGGQPWPRLAAP